MATQTDIEALTGLIGTTVLGKDGEQNVAEVCEGKQYIGLYFSAHWCPPCRGFTPILTEFYTEIQAKCPDKLEIVFVSSDRDEASWADYFSEMPWKGIPYSSRELKDELCGKFGVRGIPMFVILDAKTLEVVDPNGRNAVVSNKDNPAGFPWK